MTRLATMDSEIVDAQTPLLKTSQSQASLETHNDERDAEFGGTAARQELEKKLLWKVDKRMSILILIYILNYVCICARIVLSGLMCTAGSSR